MRNFLLLTAFAVSVLLTQNRSAFAQCNGSSALSLKEIMKGYEFIGQRPEYPVWSLDSKRIYFDWNKENKLITDKYYYEIASGETKLLNLENYDELPPYSYIKTTKGDFLYQKSGDVFLFSPESASTRTILETFDQESLIGLDELEQGFYFLRSSNIYHFDLDSGHIRQISNFSKGSPPEKDKEASQIENEELALFEIVKKRDEKEKLRKKNQEKRNAGKAKKWFYGKNKLSGIKITPDGKFIVFKEITSNKNSPTESVNFVSQDGYAQTLKGRPKVGMKRDDQKLGIFDVERDTVYYAIATELPGIYDKPKYLKEYHEGKDKYIDIYTQPKSLYFHGPKISRTGKAVLDIKSFESKDRWIAHLDLKTGELKSLDHQHDEAWIGGPGVVNWTPVPGNYGWFKNENKVYYQSEETGYSHLYTYDLKTNKKKALTRGKFEVHEADPDFENKGFWILTNEEDPGEMHLYYLDLDDLSKKKITREIGRHQAIKSPDEKWLVSNFSFSNQPGELFLLSLEEGGDMKKISNSNTPAFEAYQWRVPELIYFKAEDGASVRARIYHPEKAKKNMAAVIFVHGAGYLQNVHKGWSGYYREYMFHNMLADLGFTILDIDYRGSKGYGRDWRTGIYRHMGGKDLNDQIDGAKYLVKEHGIDTKRVGIYGGSYGGFITLMALFQSPGTFKAGAALRSVTDWAHYNHPYTSNILNTPEEDPKAYKQSSPIYFAEGLEDRLLMLHGMVDMNVQFQDIVRLSQRLIELEKENWELAVFPVEGHGFKEASSWHDEYRRILELFCEELE
jgi:dipeptidyl aminopeptidase/acylaminoacyl peptidase